MASAPKKQKRIISFSFDEKQKLIAAVKSLPRIWNIADPLHSNKNALDQAWDGISVMLEKPVKECKSAWVSLRESYLYRAKVAKQTKSGSAGGEQLPEPSFSEEVDWEFAEEMSFLPNVSQKRRTFVTIDDTYEETATTSKRSSNSQYDYTPPPSKRSRSNYQAQSQEFWKQFDDILERQSNVLKLRGDSESQFQTAFSGFEFLLKQLPKHVADETCCNFMQTLLNKVLEEEINAP